MGYNQNVKNNAFKLIRQSTLIKKNTYCIRSIVLVSRILEPNEDCHSFHLKFKCSYIHYNCNSMYYLQNLKLRMRANDCKTY